jgi:hypothetical protein
MSLTRHPSCSIQQESPVLLLETASTVNASDDEDDEEDSSTSSSSERGTLAWEQQDLNVASGLFVQTSRPLPLSVSRTIPWPRLLWGRRRYTSSMSMERTDFVTRIDDDRMKASGNGGGGGGMAYFNSAEDDEPTAISMNRSTRPGLSGSSCNIVTTRRCSTG